MGVGEGGEWRVTGGEQVKALARHFCFRLRKVGVKTRTPEKPQGCGTQG